MSKPAKQWGDLSKAERKECLHRILDALSAGEMPSLSDAAMLNQLFWIYHDEEAQKSDHGLRTEVKKKKNQSGKLSNITNSEVREQATIVVESFLHRRLPPDDARADFVARLDAYLDGTLPAAKLFGARNWNKHSWQYKKSLAEKAVWARNFIKRDKGNLAIGKGGNESYTLSTNEPGNLFRFLADISSGMEDEKLIEKHGLCSDKDTQLRICGLRDKIEVERASMSRAEQSALLLPNTWAQYYHDLIKHKH